jgi:hypothetical protein
MDLNDLLSNFFWGLPLLRHTVGLLFMITTTETHGWFVIYDYHY